MKNTTTICFGVDPKNYCREQQIISIHNIFGMRTESVLRGKMKINLTNPRYGITGEFDISRSSWLKHLEMHPNRPEEALQNNLSVCYGINVPVTSEMIEKTIEDEYNKCEDLPEIKTVARRKYEQI